MKGYKDLMVWEKSIDLVVNLYKITGKFPKEELYVLTSQIRSAAISIPSNIAEGYSLKNRKEDTRFLELAFGSASELETQLLIADRLGYLSSSDFDELNNLLIEVLKMLNAMSTKLKTNP